MLETFAGRKEKLPEPIVKLKNSGHVGESSPAFVRSSETFHAVQLLRACVHSLALTYAKVFRWRGKFCLTEVRLVDHRTDHPYFSAAAFGPPCAEVSRSLCTSGPESQVYFRSAATSMGGTSLVYNCVHVPGGFLQPLVTRIYGSAIIPGRSWGCIF